MLNSFLFFVSTAIINSLNLFVDNKKLLKAFGPRVTGHIAIRKINLIVKFRMNLKKQDWRQEMVSNELI